MRHILSGELREIYRTASVPALMYRRGYEILRASTKKSAPLNESGIFTPDGKLNPKFLKSRGRSDAEMIGRERRAGIPASSMAFFDPGMSPRLKKQGFVDRRSKIDREPPDPDQYVPPGMIRLETREEVVEEGDSRRHLVAPAGHPVYLTLIGVHSEVVNDESGEPIGSVHWATPEAVALSAEIHAEKMRREQGGES